MFRQGLRRCSGLTRIATSSSSLLVSRTALPIARQGVSSITRPVAPFKSIASILRAYSSDAAAVEEESSVSAVSGNATRFADLEQLGVHPNLLNAITKDMKYVDMTPVQAKTINPALKGTDIVAQAKTGTGKTIAFLLPMLQRMIAEDETLARKRASRDARSDDIRGIILSPTRELAEQIAVEARRLTKNTGLVVQCAVGGTHKASMLRQTQREGCHLLVATPGRLNDLLQDRSSGIEAPNLACLVLDEADRMLDVGFEKELQDILSCLPRPEEKVRQTMLVSATIPDDVIRLARTMVRANDFEFVQTIAENEALTHDRIPQNVVQVKSWNNVFPTLFELIDREIAVSHESRDNPPFKALVYFNTTSLVEMAGEFGYHRRQNGRFRIPTFAIQSKMGQNQRTRAAEMFRSSRAGILFSSDVTARGMDFPNVTHVIQVDAPRERESYIHRLGRTGRQDKGGEGWLLIPPYSVNPARKLLRGLPLKPNTTLTCAEADLAEGDQLTGYHQEVNELINTLPKQLIGGMYTSLFGAQTSDREDFVDDLNHWAKVGWGWDAAPPVSSTWARNLGLSHAALNIQDGHRYEREDRFGGRSGGRDGRDGRGGGYGRNNGRDNFGRGGFRDNGRSDRRSDRRPDRRPADPFADMGRQAHKDDNRGRGRSSW